MATKRASLRAVTADEKPETPPISSLEDAINRGTYLDQLIWQRKEAVRALPSLAGPALAAMHRQIAALGREIQTIEAAATEGTDIGDAIETPDAKFDANAL